VYLIPRKACRHELIGICGPQIHVRTSGRSADEPPVERARIVTSPPERIDDLLADFAAAGPETWSDRGNEVGRHGTKFLY
jgi:hypothetical protein